MLSKFGRHLGGRDRHPEFRRAHNVTFNVAVGVPADIPNTSSGSASATFTTAGTFKYQCTIHAEMTGVLIVH